MNCKPGDLAVVLRCTGNGAPCILVDRLVRVIELAPVNDRGNWVMPDGSMVRNSGGFSFPAWAIEFAGPTRVVAWDGASHLIARFYVMWDHRLRPIRDPGDDARDETLNWQPVPTKEIA